MKTKFCLAASLPLLFLLAFGFGGCSQESSSDAAATENAAPPNEFDVLINDYEKVANEFVRVARRHQDGDVSITVRVIELRDKTRALAAKVQHEAGKLSPQQTQRVTAISSKVAPYMQS